MVGACIYLFPVCRVWQFSSRSWVRQRPEFGPWCANEKKSWVRMCHTLQSGLVLVKKDDISKLIKDSDAENTKRQRKYAVSRMYLKTYDISCIINSSAKSNSLFGIV